MSAAKNINKLKKDVDNFVKNKIKEVKGVDEIFSIHHFDIDYKMDDATYEQLWFYKKILQLTINSYNNPENYDKFEVKFLSEKGKGLESLEKNYVYNETKGVWKCKKPSSICDLETALDNYVRCFLSIEAREKVQEVDIEKEKHKIVKCTVCETAVSDSDKCEACGTTVKEMIEQNATKSTKNNDSDNDLPHSVNNNVNNGSYIEENKDMDDKYGATNSNNGRTRNDKNEGGCKWKCGQCECLNEYTLGNCVACGSLYNKGSWICDHCTMENSCINDVCTACDNKNDNVKVNEGVNNKVSIDDTVTCDKCGYVRNKREKQCDKCDRRNKDNDDGGSKDKWKCGKCEWLWSYEVNICDGCKCTKLGRGTWQCGACTLVNKCTDKKCTACETQNDYLVDKYCAYCNKNKVSINKDGCDDCVKNRTNKSKSIQWQCRYPKCNELNSFDDKYCRVCRLPKDYPRARGETMKIWYEDAEREVWVCLSCPVINKERELVCYKCGETRYKKRFCKGCDVYNDGTTKKCDTCNQILT